MLWTILFTALWLGILTSISPCPLATNIAAISFIGRNAGKKKHVIASGLLYSAGRMIAYVALGSLITAGMLSSAQTSRFLQKYMNEALGPILIVLGLMLLGWSGTGFSININTEKLQARAEQSALLWAAPIGFVFALSFCPVSAGLFFGALLPLALKHNSPVLLPVIFGTGTSLPAIALAFIIAFGSAWAGKAFNRLATIERWIRFAAAAVFIIAGIYYCLRHIYGISF
jgi:cytochrome c biogenesis protein CcdA